MDKKLLEKYGQFGFGRPATPSAGQDGGGRPATPSAGQDGGGTPATPSAGQDGGGTPATLDIKELQGKYGQFGFGRPANSAGYTMGGEYPNIGNVDTSNVPEFKSNLKSAFYDTLTTDPEEQARMFVKDDPNLEVVVRDISDQEKDKLAWNAVSRYGMADKEYLIRDKTTGDLIYSINKPSFTTKDFQGLAGQTAAFLPAYRNMVGKHKSVWKRMPLGFMHAGGIDAIQQETVKKLGGKDEYDPLQGIIVAGAGLAGEPLGDWIGIAFEKMRKGIYPAETPKQKEIADVAEKVYNSTQKALESFKNAKIPDAEKNAEYNAKILTAGVISLSQQAGISPSEALRKLNPTIWAGGVYEPIIQRKGWTQTRETIPPRQEDGSLWNLPKDIKTKGGQTYDIGVSNDIKAIKDAYIERYKEKFGIEGEAVNVYSPVSVQWSRKTAQAFERMKHAPQDPEVKEAFQAMADETVAQFLMIREMDPNFEFELFDYNKPKPRAKTEEEKNTPFGDPYRLSPREATKDIRENKHFYVYSTEDGYGSNDLDIKNFNPDENPLLGEAKYTDETGETKNIVDDNGRKMYLNDVFRAVHDYFGHAMEGLGFRADGEYNAWRIHASMYSPKARRAMTTETHGQNSWVNYNRHMALRNRVASGENKTYAEQKTGLLPPEFSEVGRRDDGLPYGNNNLGKLAHDEEAGIDTPEFEKFFGRSVVRDGNGDPMPVYSGSKNPHEQYNDFNITEHEQNAIGYQLTPNEEDWAGKRFVKKTYVSMQNPIRYDQNTTTKDVFSNEDMEDIIKEVYKTVVGKRITKKQVDQLVNEYLDEKIGVAFGEFVEKVRQDKSLKKPVYSQSEKNIPQVMEDVMGVVTKLTGKDGMMNNDKTQFFPWASKQIKDAKNVGEFNQEARNPYFQVDKWNEGTVDLTPTQSGMISYVNYNAPSPFYSKIAETIKNAFKDDIKKLYNPFTNEYTRNTRIKKLDFTPWANGGKATPDEIIKGIFTNKKRLQKLGISEAEVKWSQVINYLRELEYAHQSNPEKYPEKFSKEEIAEKIEKLMKLNTPYQHRNLGNRFERYTNDISTNRRVTRTDENDYDVWEPPLVDYREEGISFPMASQIESTHYKDEKPLVHLRSSTENIDGKKSLVINEIQSDFFNIMKMKENEELEELPYTLLDVDESASLLELLEAEPKHIQEEFYRKRKKIQSFHKGVWEKMVPVTNYVELGVKMAVMRAVESGKRRIAWTTGQRQSNSRNSSQPSSKRAELIYDRKIPQAIKKLFGKDTKIHKTEDGNGWYADIPHEVEKEINEFGLPLFQKEKRPTGQFRSGVRSLKDFEVWQSLKALNSKKRRKRSKEKQEIYRAIENSMNNRAYNRDTGDILTRYSRNLRIDEARRKIAKGKKNKKVIEMLNKGGIAEKYHGDILFESQYIDFENDRFARKELNELLGFYKGLSWEKELKEYFGDGYVSTSKGGFSFYPDKDKAVRISNHDVPSTPEREFNAENGGFSWANKSYYDLKDYDSARELIKDFEEDSAEYLQQGRNTILGMTDPHAKGIDIHIFEEANPTTFIHEAGHFFLESLERLEPEATNQNFKDLVDNIRKLLGNKGEKFTVSQHEQFAEWITTYLQQGKTKRKMLQGVFDMFSDWIGDYYKASKQAGVPINNNIAKVMDQIMGDQIVDELPILGGEFSAEGTMNKVRQILGKPNRQMPVGLDEIPLTPFEKEYNINREKDDQSPEAIKMLEKEIRARKNPAMENELNRRKDDAKEMLKGQYGVFNKNQSQVIEDLSSSIAGVEQMYRNKYKTLYAKADELGLEVKLADDAKKQIEETLDDALNNITDDVAKEETRRFLSIFSPTNYQGKRVEATAQEFDKARKALVEGIRNAKQANNGLAQEQLGQLLKAYDNLIENELLQPMQLSGIMPEGAEFREAYKEARKAFSEYKEIFPNNNVSEELAQKIQEGNIAPSDIVGLLMSSEGDVKFGKNVVDILKKSGKGLRNGERPEDLVKDALIFKLFNKNPNSPDLEEKGLQLGLPLKEKFDRIFKSGNKTVIDSLFSPQELAGLEKAVNKLSKLNITNRKSADELMSIMQQLKRGMVFTDFYILRGIFSFLYSMFDYALFKRSARKYMRDTFKQNSTPINELLSKQRTTTAIRGLSATQAQGAEND